MILSIIGTRSEPVGVAVHSSFERIQTKQESIYQNVRGAYWKGDNDRSFERNRSWIFSLSILKVSRRFLEIPKGVRRLRGSRRASEAIFQRVGGGSNVHDCSRSVSAVWKVIPRPSFFFTRYTRSKVFSAASGSRFFSLHAGFASFFEAEGVHDRGSRPFSWRGRRPRTIPLIAF